MDLSGVLSLPDDVYGAILCALLVGIFSTYEVWRPMRDLPDLARYCKRHFALTFISLAGYGAIAYLFVWVMWAAGVVKVIGEQFWPWRAILAAGFSQALRLEVAGKQPVTGSISPADTGKGKKGDSFHTQILRDARGEIYKRLLRKRPRDKAMGRLVKAGLRAAYLPDEIREEFDDWLASACPPEKRGRMETLSESATKAKTPKIGAGILLVGLVEEGIARAVELALDRASVIVQREAFR